MPVNRLVYKKTLDKELKKGTPLEKAMEIADTTGKKTAKGIRTVSKKEGLYTKVKKLFTKKKVRKRKKQRIKYPAPGRKM